MTRLDFFLWSTESFKVESPRSGFVSQVNTAEIGHAIAAIGGGRVRIDDAIDPTVGFMAEVKIGDRVERRRSAGRSFLSRRLSRQRSGQTNSNGLRNQRSLPIGNTAANEGSNKRMKLVICCALAVLCLVATVQHRLRSQQLRRRRQVEDSRWHCFRYRRQGRSFVQCRGVVRREVCCRRARGRTARIAASRR